MVFVWNNYEEKKIIKQKESHLFTSIDIIILLYDSDLQKNLYLIEHDNGIGVPEKYHSTLFYKFTKARRPGLRKEPSVGLGMSIVKTIVEWHNGRIWFE